VELRWWSIDELSAVVDDVFFAPLHLPQLVTDVVRNGPPPEPIHIFQETK
jgi:hypothetical protein